MAELIVLLCPACPMLLGRKLPAQALGPAFKQWRVLRLRDRYIAQPHCIGGWPASLLSRLPASSASPASPVLLPIICTATTSGLLNPSVSAHTVPTPGVSPQHKWAISTLGHLVFMAIHAMYISSIPVCHPELKLKIPA